MPKRHKASVAPRSETPFPLYIVVLSVVTGLYLAIEVPFAAFLVDLLGGNPSHDALDRAEQCGRLISGLAVVLALWSFIVPALLRAGRSVIGVIAWCLLSAAVLVPAVYIGEKSIVDMIAENSGPELRQEAARAVAAREVFFQPGAELSGIDFAGAEGADSTWSAFRGLFGIIALKDPQILDRLSASERVVSAAIRRSLPSEHEFRTATIPALFDVYRLKFDGYLQVASAHQQGLSEMYRKIEEAWAKHTRNMEREGVIGENATRHGQTAGVRIVRRAVQRHGVKVPDGWDPRDKRTFVQTIAADYLPDIDSRYKQTMESILSTTAVPKPDIESFEAFLGSGAVQAAMAHDLGLARPPDFAIKQGMSEGSIRTLRGLHRDGMVVQLERAYRIDPWDFADDHRFELVGEDAVRAVFVPVIALGLSLIGAFGHLLKLANYMFILALYAKPSFLGISRLLRRRGLIRLSLLLGAAGTVATTSYAPATEITESAFYREAIGELRSHLGEPASVGLEWAISLQDWLRPTSDVMRQARLFDPLERYLTGGLVVLEETEMPLVPLLRPRPKV